jgi:hypothetical protein
MSLRLLLDEHISPEVAAQVQAKRPDLAIFSVQRWRNRAFVGRMDAALLAAAQEEELTLITYDQKTIPPLLTELAFAESDHSGVIFVDNRTIASHDIGGLVRAILSFYEQSTAWDWKNRIAFLHPMP